MATAKIIECTSSCNGVRQTSKNIDDFVVYRHKTVNVRPKIVSAAELFVTYKKNYTYNRGSNPFKGKTVTGNTIKTTKGAMDCTALCSAAVEVAQGKNQTFNYNQTPTNFTYIGKASKVNLEPGDVLCRQPSGSKGGHWMIYVGSGKSGIATSTSTKAISQNTGKALENRWKYPSDTNNKYYYNSAYNPFCGTGGNGPPSAYHNCTWYAYGRYSEIGGLKGKSNLPPLDAQLWWTRYQGKNIGSIPKPGAVVVWARNHVAVVEKVFDNGDFITSNSAWNDGSPTPSKKPSASIMSHTCNSKKDDFSAYPYFYTEYVTKASGYTSNCGKPQGFIYQIGDFYSLGDVGGNMSEVQVMDMKDRIAKLKASDNFHYLSNEEYEKSTTRKTTKNAYNIAKKYLDKLANDLQDTESEDYKPVSHEIPDDVYSDKYLSILQGDSEKRVKIRKVVSNLRVTSELIEAPFVELDFDGYIVGSYMGGLDDYPNYLSKLDVRKVNGEINQYTINLIHQIRTGEDPNVIDKLLSKVRYKKIIIRYGDCMSAKVYLDEKVIITNVSMKRDYHGNNITYTIYATSACNYVNTVKFDYPATIDRPSNVIRDLLYRNSEISPLLQDAFPEMRSAFEVDSKGYIPNNDAIVEIPAKTNLSPIEYINYLVALMSNSTSNFIGSVANKIESKMMGTAKAINGVIQLGLTAAEVSRIPGISQAASLLDTASSYFITYMDDKFKISEIKVLPIEDSLTEPVVLTNVVHNVTVGYPDENYVMDFSVDNNQSWSLLYDKGSISNEYVYSINREGQSEKTYSPSLSNTNRVLNQIEANWWNQMTNFPISATLVIRGTLAPLNLMDYINVDVRFYGQSHYTSGTYVVIGQQDIISGNGFRTNLSLLRVSNL